MQLGQAVDGVVEELGSRVLEAVPARVVGRVAEPEVGPEVDDRGAVGHEVRDEAGGRAVGQGEEDGIDLRQRASTVRPVVARCGWWPPIGSSSRPRPASPTISTFGWRDSSRMSSAPT